MNLRYGSTIATMAINEAKHEPALIFLAALHSDDTQSNARGACRVLPLPVPLSILLIHNDVRLEHYFVLTHPTPHHVRRETSSQPAASSEWQRSPSSAPRAT